MNMQLNEEGKQPTETLLPDDMQLSGNIVNARQEAVAENKTTSQSWNMFDANWKQNIVTDANAPQLYSRLVIYIFSVLFSVLFGGILLAINLKIVNKKKAIFPVLLYSIVYVGLMIYVMDLVPHRSSALPLVFNMAGAIVLYNYFWGKYIGKQFQYRTKPFWIPLLIGVLMAAFFVWAMLAGNQM